MTLLPFSPLTQPHAEFFRKMELRVCSDMHGIVAEDDVGNVMGLVMLENWTETSVFGHINIENRLCTIPLVQATMQYVFKECGMQYLLGIVPANNGAAVRFEKRIGFKEIYRLKDGISKGVDALFMKMESADAIYLPSNERAA